MTALPAIIDATGASVTEGGFKTFLTSLRAMLAETIGATGGGQADPTSGSVFRRNALYNGAMEVWQRGTGSTTCTAGARTFLADRWCVVPSGANMTQVSSIELPSGSRSRQSLQLTGAASVTTVNLQQRIPASDIPMIKRTVTFQCYVKNVTGAAYTPTLLIGTPTVLDNFTTVTNRLTQVLASCTDNAWTQVSHTVDISGYTNIDNGLQVEIQIPSGSSVASDNNYFTEIQLAPSSVVTPFARLTFAEELARCMHFYQKSFPYGTAPAQNAGVSGALSWINILSGAVGGGSQSMQFALPMRATPTMTTYNPSAANAQIRNVATAADWTGTTATVTDNSLRMSGTQDAGATAGSHQQSVHWSASAEL